MAGEFVVVEKSIGCGVVGWVASRGRRASVGYGILRMGHREDGGRGWHLTEGGVNWIKL